MSTHTMSGTKAELDAQIQALTIPIDELAPDAVRTWALAHIPELQGHKYKMVLNIQSIHNAAMSTVAGHITVVVSEVIG